MQKMVTVVGVLACVLVSAVLVGPVGKVVDDSLHAMLEPHENDDGRGDDHGRVKMLCVVAGAATAILVCLISDRSACFKLLYFNEYNSNVLVFSALSFGLVCLVPTFPLTDGRDKLDYVHCLKMLMRDPTNRVFLFCLTVLLVSIVQGSTQTFLFWHVQDLGGKDYIFGLAIVVASFSEIVMIHYGKSLVRVCLPPKTMLICLLALTLRLLWYSFFWVPWSVVPVEILHMFTNTLFWTNVNSYVDFICTPYVDRDVYFFIQAWFGNVGYALGAGIGGFGSAYLGLALTFRWEAALIFVWLLLFAAFDHFAKTQNMFSSAMASDCILSMKEPVDSSNDEIVTSSYVFECDSPPPSYWDAVVSDEEMEEYERVPQSDSVATLSPSMTNSDEGFPFIH